MFEKQLKPMKNFEILYEYYPSEEEKESNIETHLK